VRRPTRKCMMSSPLCHCEPSRLKSAFSRLLAYAPTASTSMCAHAPTTGGTHSPSFTSSPSQAAAMPAHTAVNRCRYHRRHRCPQTHRSLQPVRHPRQPYRRPRVCHQAHHRPCRRHSLHRHPRHRHCHHPRRHLRRRHLLPRHQLFLSSHSLLARAQPAHQATAAPSSTRSCSPETRVCVLDHPWK
jgi:hypothetical protein